MAGIEVVSLGIQVLSIVGYNVLQNWEDHGFWRVTTLHTVFVQANGVIKRVRKHVLGDSVSGATPEEELAREAWKLKESYAASFNMIAVAVSDSQNHPSQIQLTLQSRAPSSHRLR